MGMLGCLVGQEIFKAVDTGTKESAHKSVQYFIQSIARAVCYKFLFGERFLFIWTTTDLSVLIPVKVGRGQNWHYIGYTKYKVKVFCEDFIKSKKREIYN